MNGRHMRILGAVGSIVALGAVALIALPASGSAPAGHAFFAKLSGEHEIPDADLDGYGTFSGSFSGVKLCFGLQVVKIANPTAAHIHQGGPATANGPIKVALNFPTSGLAGASAQCKNVPVAIANAIKANPGAYYVNVHNGAFPGGAIRGQLFQATVAQDK